MWDSPVLPRAGVTQVMDLDSGLSPILLSIRHVHAQSLHSQLSHCFRSSSAVSPYPKSVLFRHGRLDEGCHLFFPRWALSLWTTRIGISRRGLCYCPVQTTRASTPRIKHVALGLHWAPQQRATTCWHERVAIRQPGSYLRKVPYLGPKVPTYLLR
jgi:hypothetical protein